MDGGVVKPAAAPEVFKPTPASDKPAAANPSKDGELLLNPMGFQTMAGETLPYKFSLAEVFMKLKPSNHNYV